MLAARETCASLSLQLLRKVAQLRETYNQAGCGPRTGSLSEGLRYGVGFCLDSGRSITRS